MLPDVDLERLTRDRRVVRARGLDVRALAADLEQSVAGDVLFDDGSRGLYAQDASNYFEVPLGVVLPRSREDVIAAVAACRAHGAPIVCRTGGTALAGQTCNEAVVLDFSRYVNALVELDPERRRARVEPGLICDDLVRAAAPFGLTWGPKPATHDRCCFGGMLANNCGGMEAQLGGIAVHNVEALDVLLYDGTTLHLGWMTEDEFERAARADGRSGQIHRELRRLRDRVGPLVRERFPRIPRRVSGYNLDALLPNAEGRINLARAIVGTEGTCAIMLEATLRLLPVPPHEVVVVSGFRDVFEAADAVPGVLPFQPMICEGMDHVLVQSVCRKGGRHEQYLPLLPEGRAFLMVKLGGQTREEARSRAAALGEALRRSPYRSVSARIFEDRSEQNEIWKLRESGLGATAFVPGMPDSWPGWEDSAVAPDRLGDYLRDLRALMDRHGYHPSLYGHFGQGLVHCRIGFDLTTAAGIRNYESFVREAADLCAGKYGGSLSGEHGDGQSRGFLLERMFGKELVDAFAEFKRIWDPDWKLNPGKIVDPKPATADLRLGASYDPWEPETHFKFPADRGSFARATLRCVGVGKCRRTGAPGEAPDDVMCPSYMVTRDERHSTRGRAHLLWEMLRGGDSPIKDGFRDENVKDALDLCLSCKGCKGDCPVNVDVATYKAEFLAHYYEGRLRPRYAYAFGLIDKWARLASLAPGLVNLLTHSKATGWLAKLAAGMSPDREAPRFAGETFVAWHRRRGASPAAEPSKGRVVLWPDTFNNHFHPETARAALEVLEAAGYEVIVPDRPMCCGRPLYDYGFLDLAERYLERVLEGLKPWVDEGLPIVVLEPSCASVFRDELPNLMPARVEAERLRDRTKLLSELLAEDGEAELPKLHRKAIVQGHCHEKSVLGSDAERTVLRRMGLDSELLSSGCCGLAGSFGFERDRDKQEVSDACGERVLFPRVRGAGPETLVVANGFSCRTQIAQGTGRRALHLAEVLKLALDFGPDGPPPRHVESSAPDRRAPEIAAGRGLACLAAAALIGFAAFRLRARTSDRVFVT
jgi:FAD/FMN-containing dehydrogenase/Fe-S oxidoreductase